MSPEQSQQLSSNPSTALSSDDATAITTIALFAAFADGGQSDVERARVSDVVRGLGDAGLSEALRKVVFRETSAKDEAARLNGEQARTLAWETALGVCEADGATSEAERRFLDELAQALGRSRTSAEADVKDADAISRAATDDAIVPLLPQLSVAPPPSLGAAADPRGAEVDATILRYAILTASIELLPQGLATLAILPLQTKMVHGVGKSYGYPLSAASIKEFAATVGVGMTGQAIERGARKFLNLVGGGIFGGVGRAAANWGTGPALTFATTHAMGMVAKRYYGGGRTISVSDLKEVFAAEVERAKGLYTRHASNVEQTASRTDARTLLQSLKA